MLVINRVEFIEFDEAQKVRELKGKHPFRFQKNLETFYKVVEIRNLGKNVVADDEVGEPILRLKFLRHCCPEEPHHGRNALFHGDLGDIGGRLNSQHWNALFDEELQQIAVIAGHLGDEAPFAEVES